MSSSGATESALPEPREILYINVSRIGDTLLVTPAVRAVAARWPQARITLLAHPKREEVLRKLPFVQRTGGIEKQRARFMGRIGNPFAGKAYDLAFVCNFDAPLVDYALRVARRVVAFRQPDAALNRRLYRAVEHPALQTTHAVDIQLMLPAALGVAPNATLADIKKAFRQKAAFYHPDRNAAPDAAARFREAQNAYDVLSDPERRQQYDDNRRRNLLDDPLQTAGEIWQAFVRERNLP